MPAFSTMLGALSYGGEDHLLSYDSALSHSQQSSTDSHMNIQNSAMHACMHAMATMLMVTGYVAFPINRMEFKKAGLRL